VILHIYAITRTRSADRVAGRRSCKHGSLDNTKISPPAPRLNKHSLAIAGLLRQGCSPWGGIANSVAGPAAAPRTPGSSKWRGPRYKYERHRNILRRTLVRNMRNESCTILYVELYPVLHPMLNCQYSKVPRRAFTPFPSVAQRKPTINKPGDKQRQIYVKMLWMSTQKMGLLVTS